MWREMDGREPCPRCGKMLKPLSPAAKARYLKLDSLMEPEARERLADIYGAAGTVRHICKPGPAEREAAALRDELERVEALAEGRETRRFLAAAAAAPAGAADQPPAAAPPAPLRDAAQRLVLQAQPLFLNQTLSLVGTKFVDELRAALAGSMEDERVAAWTRANQAAWEAAEARVELLQGQLAQAQAAVTEMQALMVRVSEGYRDRDQRSAERAREWEEHLRGLLGALRQAQAALTWGHAEMKGRPPQHWLDAMAAVARALDPDPDPDGKEVVPAARPQGERGSDQSSLRQRPPHGPDVASAPLEDRTSPAGPRFAIGAWVSADCDLPFAPRLARVVAIMRPRTHSGGEWIDGEYAYRLDGDASWWYSEPLLRPAEPPAAAAARDCAVPTGAQTYSEPLPECPVCEAMPGKACAADCPRALGPSAEACAAYRKRREAIRVGIEARDLDAELISGHVRNGLEAKEEIARLQAENERLRALVGGAGR